jgi:hypothetical protein
MTFGGARNLALLVIAGLVACRPEPLPKAKEAAFGLPGLPIPSSRPEPEEARFATATDDEVVQALRELTGAAVQRDEICIRRSGDFVATGWRLPDGEPCEGGPVLVDGRPFPSAAAAVAVELAVLQPQVLGEAECERIFAGAAARLFPFWDVVGNPTVTHVDGPSPGWVVEMRLRHETDVAHTRHWAVRFLPDGAPHSAKLVHDERAPVKIVDL